MWSASVFQGGAGRPHPGADEEGEQFLQHLGPAADRGLHGQHLPRSLPNIFHEYVGSWGAAMSRGGGSGAGKRGLVARLLSERCNWVEQPKRYLALLLRLLDLKTHRRILPDAQK